MQIPKSSFLETVNNLNASLPFRLYDIFNHLNNHVCVFKEQPLKKVKTDEVKEYYDLCFILACSCAHSCLSCTRPTHFDVMTLSTFTFSAFV